jgi:hypothetical protein
MVQRIAAIIILSTWLCAGAAAAEPDLSQDIIAVRQQIADAERELAQYQGGLIKVLVQARLETLRLSEAMLEQKELAEKSGATFSYTLAAVAPDEKRARELLGDIDAAEKELADLEAKNAQYSGGLVKALSESSVATQRQSLAMLKQAYYVAHYGLYYPSASSSVGAGDKSSAATEETSPPASASEPAYVTALRKNGAEIVGSWGIVRSKSEMDDSPAISAYVGQSDQSSPAGNTAMFRVGCYESEPAAMVIADDYLLADDDMIAAQYRLDDLPAVSQRWSVSTSNKAAGYWGKEAIGFAHAMEGHQRLIVQVTERNGQSHRYAFNIDGADKAIEDIALECGWSGFDVSEADVMKAQKTLMRLGFYKGALDGQWGGGSRGALIDFQKSKGLPPTGLLDKLTRSALGP